MPFDDFISLETLQNISKKTLGDYVANDQRITDDFVQSVTINKNDDGIQFIHIADGCILSDSLDEVKDESLTEEEKQRIREQYDDEMLLFAYDASNTGPFASSKLAVSLQVQSFLSQFQPRSGKYGIRIVVSGISKGDDVNSATALTEEVYFTNDDMLGNTYAYSTQTVQQKIFDISSFLSIDSVKAYFWQDFAFVDFTGESIRWREMPSNLFISDIQMYFGVTADEIGEEKAFIYTQDMLTYGQDVLGELNRVKVDARTLNLAWIHYDNISEKFVLINTKEKLGNWAEVYWYRYEYGCTVNEELGKKASLGGPNWQYMENGLLVDSDFNATLEEIDNKFTIVVQPSITKSRERYKAVIYYHTNYEKLSNVANSGIGTATVISEQLTLSNAVDIETVNASIAANKEIIFTFFREPTQLERISYDRAPEEAYAYYSKDTGFALVEDENIPLRLVYDENNRVLRNSDGICYSDLDYYVQIRMLQPTEDKFDNYVPLVFADGTSITWTTPSSINNRLYSGTMIEAKNWEDSNVYWSDTELSFIPEDEQETFKAITRKFRISPIWDVNDNNNVVSAQCTHNGKTYYLNQPFTFGPSGSMGSKYTVAIKLMDNVPYLYAKTNFGVQVVVYDADGAPVENVRCVWNIIGGTLLPKKDENDENNISKGSYINYQTLTFQAEDDQYQYQSFQVDGDNPPIFEVTVLDVGDYPLTTRASFPYFNFQPNDTYVVACPNRVEYKSDGTLPYYDTSDFMVTLNGSVIHPTWDLAPFEDSILSLQITSHNNQTVYYNGSNSQETDAYDSYALRCNKKTDGNQVIPWTWSNDLLQRYDRLICNLADNNEIIIPIVYAQNVYPSSLINSWDSSELIIDNGNNAVLAKMISAGAKDSDNRFSGVLMGNWEDNADASLDGIGLYGFNKGRQSFGLKSDGTGFIGIADKGQIQFDGNQALISNSDKTMYMNLNPIKVSKLGNENYILDGNSKDSYSPYFLYAQTRRTATTETWTANSLPEWAEHFYDDVNNDYFVVDVNNGILTTGGILARYGRIGEWAISAKELYHQWTDNTSSSATKYEMKIGGDDYIIAGPVGKSTFKVDKNGKIFATEGEIGNWTLTENYLKYVDLTDQKISGIIYIGNGTRDNKPENENVNWSFWAGDNEETQNFGVTTNGALLANAGLIGGWAIAPSILSSADGTIQLDAGTNQIRLGNSTVINGDGSIVLNKQIGNIAAGYISLGGIELIGVTGSPYSTYSVANTSTTKDPASAGGQTNILYWGGGTNNEYTAGSYTINTSKTGVLTSVITPAEKTTTAELKMKYGTQGISLALNDSTTILLPSNEKNAWLGAAGHLWNIYADIVQCADLQIPEGNINAGAIYMSNQKVATEIWVYNQLADVYNALSTLSAAIGKASATAKSAANANSNGVNTVANGLGSILSKGLLCSPITYTKGELTFSWIPNTGSGSGTLNTDTTTVDGNVTVSVPDIDKGLITISLNGNNLAACISGDQQGTIWNWLSQRCYSTGGYTGGTHCFEFKDSTLGISLASFVSTGNKITDSVNLAHSHDLILDGSTISVGGSPVWGSSSSSGDGSDSGSNTQGGAVGKGIKIESIVSCDITLSAQFNKEDSQPYSKLYFKTYMDGNKAAVVADTEAIIRLNDGVVTIYDKFANALDSITLTDTSWYKDKISAAKDEVKIASTSVNKDDEFVVALTNGERGEYSSDIKVSTLLGNYYCTAYLNGYTLNSILITDVYTAGYEAGKLAATPSAPDLSTYTIKYQSDDNQYFTDWDWYTQSGYNTKSGSIWIRAVLCDSTGEAVKWGATKRFYYSTN